MNLPSIEKELVWCQIILPQNNGYRWYLKFDLEAYPWFKKSINHMKDVNYISKCVLLHISIGEEG